MNVFLSPVVTNVVLYGFIAPGLLGVAWTLWLAIRSHTVGIDVCSDSLQLHPCTKPWRRKPSMAQVAKALAASLLATFFVLALLWQLLRCACENRRAAKEREIVERWRRDRR